MENFLGLGQIAVALRVTELPVLPGAMAVPEMRDFQTGADEDPLAIVLSRSTNLCRDDDVSMLYSRLFSFERRRDRHYQTSSVRD